MLVVLEGNMKRYIKHGAKLIVKQIVCIDILELTPMVRLASWLVQPHFTIYSLVQGIIDCRTPCIRHVTRPEARSYEWVIPCIYPLPGLVFLLFPCTGPITEPSELLITLYKALALQVSLYQACWKACELVIAVYNTLYQALHTTLWVYESPE